MTAAGINEDDIQRKYQVLDREAEEGGYHLNPDVRFTQNLLRGMLINEARYGYPACPCRLSRGIKSEDLDIICPCDYRDPDLNSMPLAIVHYMYPMRSLTKKQSLSPVPERRPPRSERKSSEAIHITGPGSLSYPVWRCRVCGYLCARDEAPLVCPVCKAKKDRFERFM